MVSLKTQEKVEKAGKSGKSREKQEKENSGGGGALVGRGVKWTPGVACPLAATLWEKHHTALHNISVFVFDKKIFISVFVF